MQNTLTEYDAMPLLAVVTAVRDAGRRRRDEGGAADDELILLAYRCHAVLKWMEADEAGDLEQAQKWLDLALADS